MLPQIYRKLDYIENAILGSYIDTGLLAFLDMKVVVDGMAFEGNTALFGSRTQPMSADCFALQFLGGGSMVYRFNINSVQKTAPLSFPKGVRHIFTFGNTEFRIDDTVIGNAKVKALEQNYPIYMLGAMNNSGEASAFGITRIYSAQFYRGEELVASFIPCISEEGQYGVYDDVREMFFANAGEGELTGNPEEFIKMEITSFPTKLCYKVGEEFDRSGLVVEAFCESGYHTTVTDYEVLGFDSSVPGAKIVTISYEGLTASFSVIVEEVPIEEPFITVDEMKQYLRIDFDDDDALLEMLITSSEKLCMDIARMTNKNRFEKQENAKISVMYAVSYQYEHREDCDHHALTLSLRSLLFGIRKVGF